MSVKLYKDNTVKTITVHRLVAEAYLDNPLGLPQVNHKDEVKTHNYVNNLEWCSAKENNNYGTRTERAKQTETNNPDKSVKVRCVETNIIYPSMNEAER